MNPPQEPDTTRTDASAEAPADSNRTTSATTMPLMETTLDATARLRNRGYAVDFTATDEGHLRCGACGTDHDPATMTIDETVRYEGASNPDDETILLALRCSCEQAGLYMTAFGPNASIADTAVLQRL